MNQLGPIFKEARAKSGKTIDDAVRETKIAKKYLIAIEDENFDIFPGETYLLGFLRNYSQFLGLDPDEMVLKYRDYKIQEQPAPIEQLTAKPKNTRRYLLTILVALLVVSSVLYILLSGRKDQKGQKAEKVETEEQKKPAETSNVYEFDEEEIIRDFKKGDIIKIPVSDKVYTISIDGISDNLAFSIMGIPFNLSTDERVEVDFDRDGRKDVMIRTNRLGEGTVNLTLKKLYQSAGGTLAAGEKPAVETETSGRETSGRDTSGRDTSGRDTSGRDTSGRDTPEVVILKENDLLSKIPIAPKSGFQIVSSYEKTDIAAVLKAVQTSYLGYIIDEGEKKEALLHDGDELTLQAKDVLRLMVANSKGIDLRINEIMVPHGEDRAITAKIIRWYRDRENSDLYHLIIDDWEK